MTAAKNTTGTSKTAASKTAASKTAASKTAASKTAASKADETTTSTTDETTPDTKSTDDAAAAQGETTTSGEATVDASSASGDASAETGSETGAGADQTGDSDGAADSTVAHSAVVETGPNTGVAAPPENSARPPATIVNDGAAPLDPPADHHLTRQPAAGYTTSSTDQTYAEAGGRTIAGENHIALVGRDGKPVDVDTLFHRESAHHTYVTATQRVSEVFTTHGSKTPSKRLLFAEGARVPLAQAMKIEAAAKADGEAAAASTAE